VLERYQWKGTAIASWTNTLIIPAVRLLDDVFRNHGYVVKSAGSYNYRLITNGSVYSPHAWALAIDINPANNPYTGRLVTDIGMDIIRDAYKITAKGQRVWKWGGDWDGDWNFDEHTVFDAMHFEMIATPDELMTGVYFAGNAEQPEIDMLKLGSRGLAVYDMRAGLSEYFNDDALMLASPNPQLFDTVLKSAVERFQAAYGLPVTGTIDGVTAVEIRSWVRPRVFA
jgi:D-alanyl-D-alanine carboxypeptidase-like protein/putative peptidoglycan binding protein